MVVLTIVAKSEAIVESRMLRIVGSKHSAHDVMSRLEEHLLPVTASNSATGSDAWPTYRRLTSSNQ